MDDEKLNEELEEMETASIMLTDEDGKDTMFEFLDLIKYEENEYIVLSPIYEEDEEIEDEVNVQWCKQYFNCSSNLKVVNEYNNIGFEFFENKYIIYLKKKDGRGYSPFKDENGNMVEYIFQEKPTALELGTKVMEMFEYKERYDGLIE